MLRASFVDYGPFVASSRPRRPRPPGSLASLRHRNRGRIIDALRGAQLLSRAELARATGLSRSTVSTVVAELIDDDIVSEGAANRPSLGGTGRPGVTLCLNPSAGAALGVDIGYARLRVLVSDLAGTVRAELDAPSPDPDDAPAIIDATVALVQQALAEAAVGAGHLVGAAAAVPAPVDRETGLLGVESCIPALAGIDVGGVLSDRLGFAIRAENDANLCAVAERLWGDHPGHETMLYVKLAHGVGSGLIIGGRLHRGFHGTAGEVGHTSLSPDGPLCKCGNRGCLERMAQGVMAGEPSRTSRRSPLADLVERAEHDDPVARRALRDVGALVGQALGATVNLLNPSLIVVGGDITPAWQALENPVREALDRCAMHRPAEGVVIVPGALGVRAEVLGAVGLALREAPALPFAA